MSGPLVQLAPSRLTVREVLRIAASMTATCAIGAAILGAIFIATNRYSEAARARNERLAVMEMLGLDSSANVLQVHQYLDAARQQIVYRTDPESDRNGQELVFTFDGSLVRHADLPHGAADTNGLEPLGRMFIATRNGTPAGFVTEAETQGYKNRIRFFVAIDPQFEVAGVRVVEHEEDPGLGAEVATTWFQGQFVARPLSSLTILDVTRDPMPEDWREALHQRDGMSPDAWRGRFIALLSRETRKPIYAVTGATISSRTLTNGVRTAAQHFQRRWALLAPYLQPAGGHS
jgi:H+/Na+-translocating ferredoxin:NAD+ oxidoreductase subunit G